VVGLTKWGRDIEALEGGDAGSLGLHDVICCRETKVVSGEGKGDIGKRGHFLTINRISTIPRLLCSDFLVQQLPALTLMISAKRDFLGLWYTSARSEGRAIREVPVSMAAPVFSNSSVSSPKEKLSRLTSQ
jgi:hypothetical protein